MSRELPQSRYDLSTYAGRVRHTMEITDPRTLLTSGAQIEQAKRVLATYAAKDKAPLALDETFWRSKKIVDASCHPETGEHILLPFRMSCFVLTNLVVTAGMLTPNMGTRGTLFWQVTNQSVNVAFNYANANKSSPGSVTEIGASYLVAVAASCSLALGLNAAARRIRPGVMREIGARLVPFVAVAGAGALNVCLMRSGELRSGIFVEPSGPSSVQQNVGQDDGGRKEERSRRAAVTAIWETAASRVLNATPIMILPPLLLLAIGRRRVLSPRAALGINLASILATSLVALPLAIAAFPTTEVLATEVLEDGVRQRLQARGVEQVVFNRGM